MAVYKPTRKGEASKFYICEFVYQGKRFQESTGATSKTVAKEYEKRRKAEMERAAAGLPTEQKATRIRTVRDVTDAYIAGYKLNHRPKSILFAEGRLKRVKEALGSVVLSDLTEDCIRGYIRARQGDKAPALQGRRHIRHQGLHHRRRPDLARLSGTDFHCRPARSQGVDRQPRRGRPPAAEGVPEIEPIRGVEPRGASARGQENIRYDRVLPGDANRENYSANRDIYSQ